jgi:hypothetical protein
MNIPPNTPTPQPTEGKYRILDMPRTGVLIVREDQQTITGIEAQQIIDALNAFQQTK